MTYDDLHRDLRNNIVMHKNRPVYVTAIGHDCSVMFRDLGTQKEGIEKFFLEAFTNPVRRVGFVNVMGSVVYVQRIPVRKFSMGLSANNTQVKSIMGIDYEQGAAATKQRVMMLCVPEVAEAIMDKYPSFEEAVARVKKFTGAVAFDKQFAVTSRRRVFYRGEEVGTFKQTATRVTDIEWFEGKQYLSILLDRNYEKTVRDFRPA